MILLGMGRERPLPRKSSRLRILLGTFPLLMWILLDLTFLYAVFSFIPASERILLIVPYFVLTFFFQLLSLVKALKSLDNFFMWEEATLRNESRNVGFLGVTPPPSLQKRVEALRKELEESKESKSMERDKKYPDKPVMPEVKLSKEEIEYLYK